MMLDYFESLTEGLQAKLAKRTEGFSGADLKAVVDQAVERLSALGASA